MLFASIYCYADNKQFVVVLDAGHGGHDAGAVGLPKTNREKDINLAITLKVGELLKQNCPDVNVLYTRNKDVFVTLGDRASIANKAKADLFISIHTNAIERSPYRQPMGVQSYTLSLKTAGTNLEVEKRENSVIQFEADGALKYSFANPNSSESDIMFELMQDRDMQESVNFAKLARNEMVHSAGRKDLGVLQANLAVLRLTYMPSVLLEVGFISTPAEEQFLMSNEGRTIMAQAIYNAIVKYKTQHTGRMSNLEKIDFKNVAKQIAQNNNINNNKPTDTPQNTNKTTNNNQTFQLTPVIQNPVQNNNENATPKNNKDLASSPVFELQLFASVKMIPAGSPQFKGINANYYMENNLYKYTFGATTDYNEIIRIKKEISTKFPEAFIIAFKDGIKMSLNDAIKEWKKNK